MELLVYGNRKQDDYLWDISTPEKRAAAFLELFVFLRDDWQVYECGTLSAKEKEWYDKAQEGDASAAEKLLTKRKSYEYEEWYFAETRN